MGLHKSLAHNHRLGECEKISVSAMQPVLEDCQAVTRGGN
jgi:hypothetical protein